MSAVIVDTDVVSYLFKSHPTALLYLPDLKDRTAMISFMTVAELDRWALEARWGEARRNWLREYLERFVVLPYNRDLCATWAAVTKERSKFDRALLAIRDHTRELLPPDPARREHQRQPGKRQASRWLRRRLGLCGHRDLGDLRAPVSASAEGSGNGYFLERPKRVWVCGIDCRRAIDSPAVR